MTTANEIIAESLGAIGMLNAGETASAEDSLLCLSVLNTMIDAWNLPSLTQYTTQDATATLGSGVGSLTIGPSMTIAVTRPTRIELGSYVRSEGIDYPMSGLNEAEYNRISLKSVNGHVPRFFFYDAGTLTGTIYYWPVPNLACVVHHPVATQFEAFADLVTSYNFPQGYKRAMVFNLALEIAPHFEQPPAPWIESAAKKSLRLVKKANYQVPELDNGDSEPGILEGFYSGYST